jgi:hypothetical protein
MSFLPRASCAHCMARACTGLGSSCGQYTVKHCFILLIKSETLVDNRMSPDLLRGTGKSIGGDLNVDDEGSEQCRFEPVQSLHNGSVGYQLMHT